MIVYVVKTTVYGYGTDPDTGDIYGVYSNLALAGRAVTMIVDNARADGDALIYEPVIEEPWGYVFQLCVLEDGKWDYGEIEISRVIVDE
jgi:hypothetical protein